MTFPTREPKPGPLSFSLPHTYAFAAPLFPEHIRLFLDLSTRTVVLLRFGKGESVLLLRSQKLTPSGIIIFLALLQAYPKHCTFEKLFACLDLPQPLMGMTHGSKHGANWELVVRPVRRAIAVLTPVLPAFGLQTTSLRNKGYLLVLDREAFAAFFSEHAIIQTESEIALYANMETPP